MAMAEPSCLRRSLSNPSELTSHDFQQGDPLRALGESISFGRYMSESLAWEKWSTFTNNRYLEEAEKYSRPGSVAKMKAHFEAYYSRFGAKKRAAQEQTINEPSSEVRPEVQGTVADSSSYAEITRPSSHATGCEFSGKDTPKEEVLSNGIVSSYGSSTPRQDEETKIVDPDVNVDTAENYVEVPVHRCEDVEPKVSANDNESYAGIKVHQCEDALESSAIVSTPQRKLPLKMEVEKGELDLKMKHQPADSSRKMSTKSNVSKLSSSLAGFMSPVRPKMEGGETCKSRKRAKEPLEKKKPVTTIVYKSNNSDMKKMKKTSPASHKTGVGKVFTPLGKIVRDKFAPSPAPGRASVNSVSLNPSATPRSETRRRKIAVEKSFATSSTSDRKFQAPAARNMNSSVQSSSTFSSFSFRTEERAAKRREFLQKRLEKEAAVLQLQDKAKVKPKDIRKSSKCVNLKARTEVLSDNAKKSAPTRTPLPKCGSKPSSDLARGTCSQPSQMSLSSKFVAEKKKTIPTQSASSQTENKRQENACPNLL